MIKVVAVKEGSIPWKKGLRKNACLTAINGVPVDDQFDAIFQASADTLTVEIRKAEGGCRIISMPSSSLGDIALQPLVSRRCGAHCIFCFVDQLPPGLRRTLYHKDEDYRFSYLYGNYVTMANIRERDLDKIVKYRLSPLYISVHATDPAVRGRLLGFRKEKPVMPVLSYLASNRITTHCQIVLCKGINDGSILESTVKDLASLYPFVNSLSVVPVGLTGFRDGLHTIEPFSRSDARQVFNLIEPLQKQFSRQKGTPFVYLSDEFYMLAGMNFPSTRFYGEFPQSENGVGLFSIFERDARKLLSRRLRKFDGRHAAVVTGTLAYARLLPWVRALSDKTGISIRLVKAGNRLFGGRVSVTGLLGGNDVLRSVASVKTDILLVPDVMLRDRENMFLDDMTLAELSVRLGYGVRSFPPLLSDLCRVLCDYFTKNQEGDK